LTVWKWYWTVAQHCTALTRWPGVVNLIPIKRFDGIRTRVSHQRDEGGNFEDNRLGILMGREFNNGVSYVFAADYANTTPLMMFENPRLLRADFGWANSGNPGVFRRVNGANPVHQVNCIGGTLTGGNLRIPVAAHLMMSLILVRATTTPAV
jgi:iron complex outermembrane recepter protein